jgi:hypothetical protein
MLFPSEIESKAYLSTEISLTLLNFVDIYWPSSEIAQSLNFKYLYKSHCESGEFLWAFRGYHII